MNLITFLSCIFPGGGLFGAPKPPTPPEQPKIPTPEEEAAKGATAVQRARKKAIIGSGSRQANILSGSAAEDGTGKVKRKTLG